ncbi:MAG: tetratricopeptide repeat protein [Candidatus Methylomirabilia bacterium]
MGAGSARHRITPSAAAYALLLLVVVVFNPAFGNQFINFDDPGYITRNPMVQSGVTRDSLRWAFTSFDNANWHPLTWVSHMLDTELFGALPFGSHLMNVVYHAAAAALLFVVLQRLTGARWTGFLAAALFAVHPLRVESVAWAAERKDVLSACFWMLTLLAYIRYVRRPGARRFLPVVVAFALGLMAKPMLVTLPLLLLLLDWWPLGRTGGAGPLRVRLGRLVLEKLPLLILSALSAVVTFKAQVFGGAVVPLVSLSVGKRLANAAVALVVYLEKIFWPTKLSMYYARPSGGIGPLAGGGALLLLILVTLAAALAVRRRPYLLVGWIWYLVALLPVLGIVQVGYQPWADRYTYIPSIGITVAVLWLAADVARRHRRAQPLLIAAVAGAVLIFSLATQRYISVWRDGVTLFRRALGAGGETYMMRFCLGGELVKAGRVDEAIVEFSRGLVMNPQYPDGHFGIGVALDMKGNLEKAARHYRRALELNPRKAETQAYFATLLERTGDPAGAEEHFREALRLQPGYLFAYEGVCRVLERAGLTSEPPLFPACGGENGWWVLDKTSPLTYVAVGE